jgi:hypothetical protein
MAHPALHLVWGSANPAGIHLELERSHQISYKAQSIGMYSGFGDTRNNANDPLCMESAVCSEVLYRSPAEAEMDKEDILLDILLDDYQSCRKLRLLKASWR